MTPSNHFHAYRPEIIILIFVSFCYKIFILLRHITCVGVIHCLSGLLDESLPKNEVRSALK